MSKSLSLTVQLAKHLQRKVDDETRARARLHFLDWLGCVAGAQDGDVGRIAKRASGDPLRSAALLGSVLYRFQSTAGLIYCNRCRKPTREQYGGYFPLL